MALDWLPLENIRVTGDLRQRALRLFDRLESAQYHPDKVLCSCKPECQWPGDFEGRTILALTLLARITGRRPKYLAEILRRFPICMNERGYFGTVHEEFVDEQQLSSHGWVLRGLCEQSLFGKRPELSGMIRRIVENLALPTRGLHREYPIRPKDRTHGGGACGEHAARNGRWRLSTDIGCDFIFLDGLVQAYQLFRLPELGKLIEEMIQRFKEMDLVAIQAQTHATLTGLRGVLRYAEMIGNESLVREVEKRFDIYVSQGMTENYENYNWFGRPEWTEPCGIIDSLILAAWLWNLTGDPARIELAHRIYYNGLLPTQRDNGGFGTDTCLGAKDPYLAVSTYEAFWCCTMRGGEGLASAARFFVCTDRDTLVLPFFFDGRIHWSYGGTTVRFAVKTDYPIGGWVQIRVTDAAAPVRARLRLFAPSFASGHRLNIDGKPVDFTIRKGFADFGVTLRKGTVIEWCFDPIFRNEETIGEKTLPGFRRYTHGPLLLGTESSREIRLAPGAEWMQVVPGVYRLRKGKVLLKPLAALVAPKRQSEEYRLQVLFKAK
jgi:hypothetical protein